ncbi:MULTISPECIES: ABC transporter ATP-binding protein [unclassified Schaalia]|uniref:ABC transporter ATP-binding protein n=1 Tax=unclassified Schaalia TaxID=2691889 RepID=UPI001E2F613B|nr:MULTISPECIES: ATP-binding cassette domain-containing protein [unclassified Schaalia]MCD4549411.1 ATP-binding cassette domain-containing protein [Schaalia sp. lx-260]MCD4557972.1 ATP-binding cassette domain-containing protein [Schaalia sp. lx-100]
MDLHAYGIHYTYPRSTQEVVTDWSHSFTSGTITAITGMSGSGKSTRLYMLALMVKIKRGEIWLDDRRVDNLTDRERAAIRAHHFGFIFQDAALDATRSVLDNIVETSLYQGRSPRDLRERALRLMEEMNVDVPALRKPGQISGGQAQRIAVCRALVTNPQIIFADEPTGNLDSITSALVLRTLKEHAQNGGTVIMVTHDPEVSDFADYHCEITAVKP